MSDMSNDELLKIFGKAVLEKMNDYDDIALFLHLKEVLVTSFERIKGAWGQYKDKEIDKEGFITSGIYVLGEDFVNIFLDDPKKQELISKGPKLTDIKSELTPAPKLTPKEVTKPVEEESPRKGLESIDLESLDLEIQIPLILFDEDEGVIEDDPFKVSIAEPEKPKVQPAPTPKPLPKAMPLNPVAISTEKPKVMPLKPEALSAAKPTVKPIPMPAPQLKEIKVEHVAPEIKTRSSLEALHTVDIALDKVKLEPLKFDRVADSELKSVNVGAQLPGTLVYDLFNEARELIYDKQYDEAGEKLEQIKDHAERNNDDEAFDRAVDMMANLSAYKMIPILIEAGDKVSDQPGKAAEKYNKALGFAKTLKDDHYLVKIRERLNRLSSSVNVMLAKKDFEEQEEIKKRNLMKQNIIELSKKETLMSLEDVVKYSNAKSPEFVKEILIEMIKAGEVFAKYFLDSDKVLFDKQANIDKIRLKIDF